MLHTSDTRVTTWLQVHSKGCFKNDSDSIFMLLIVIPSSFELYCFGRHPKPPKLVKVGPGLWSRPNQYFAWINNSSVLWKIMPSAWAWIFMMHQGRPQTASQMPTLKRDIAWSAQDLQALGVILHCLVLNIMAYSCASKYWSCFLQVLFPTQPCERQGNGHHVSNRTCQLEPVPQLLLKI